MVSQCARVSVVVLYEELIDAPLPYEKRESSKLFFYRKLFFNSTIFTIHSEFLQFGKWADIFCKQQIQKVNGAFASNGHANFLAFFGFTGFRALLLLWLYLARAFYGAHKIETLKMEDCKEIKVDKAERAVEEVVINVQ